MFVRASSTKMSNLWKLPKDEVEIGFVFFKKAIFIVVAMVRVTNDRVFVKSTVGFTKVCRVSSY
jgi:hypothetical protein